MSWQLRVSLVQSNKMARRKLPDRGRDSQKYSGFKKVSSSIANQNDFFHNNKGIDIDEDVEVEEEKSDDGVEDQMLKDIHREQTESIEFNMKGSGASDAEKSNKSKDDGDSSDDSGSTMNTDKIMNERETSSKQTRRRMFFIIICNIVFNLIQIPIIYECHYNGHECNLYKHE